MVQFNKIMKQGQQLFLIFHFAKSFPLPLMIGSREHVHYDKCEPEVYVELNMAEWTCYPLLGSNGHIYHAKNVGN